MRFLGEVFKGARPLKLVGPLRHSGLSCTQSYFAIGLLVFDRLTGFGNRVVNFGEPPNPPPGAHQPLARCRIVSCSRACRSASRRAVSSFAFSCLRLFLRCLSVRACASFASRRAWAWAAAALAA